MMVNVTW